MNNGVMPGSREDRAVGSLVGLAIGDALGTPVEFMNRGDFEPVSGMRGGGVFKLRPGEWTDDTSMAIALGEALLLDRMLADPSVAMNRWVNWYHYGMHSHTGTCFDIGQQTARALDAWADARQLPTFDSEGAGNGGIMRLAPAVIANLDNREIAECVAVRQSDFTHRNPICRTVSGELARILFLLIDGDTAGIVPPHVAARPITDVKSSGFVLDTFEAALWAFAPQDGFAATLLRAVNLGDDADTVGAVTGQIAGARYGLSAIPADWLSVLAWRNELIALARKLYASSLV
jgi:ADP-ribosyl-[dinitrogen reductase] hydrolase